MNTKRIGERLLSFVLAVVIALGVNSGGVQNVSAEDKLKTIDTSNSTSNMDGKYIYFGSYPDYSQSYSFDDNEIQFDDYNVGYKDGVKYAYKDGRIYKC